MTELKLGLFLSITFLFLLVVILLVLLKTIGNMSHSLNRLEEIISKEVILTYNMKINGFKADKQREAAAHERKRRQEALLNVPLVENPNDE